MLTIRPPCGHVPHGSLAGHVHSADVDRPASGRSHRADTSSIGPIRKDARVVHQDVDPAEFGSTDPLDRPTSPRTAAALSAPMASPRRPVGLDAGPRPRRAALLRPRIGDRDIGTAFGQPRRDGGSDPPASARHQGHLSGQIGHRDLLFVVVRYIIIHRAYACQRSTVPFDTKMRCTNGHARQTPHLRSRRSPAAAPWRCSGDTAMKARRSAT